MRAMELNRGATDELVSASQEDDVESAAGGETRV